MIKTIGRKIVALTLVLYIIDKGGVLISPPAPSPTLEQRQTDELHQLIDEGLRLLQKGDKESLVTAIKKFQAALQLSRAQGNQCQQARALLWLGHIYNDLGDYPKALEFYHQSLPLHREVGDRLEEASTLNNIGSVYNTLRDQSKALRFYKQALSLYQYPC
jgi:tetratricopeptide (TPR) repeat protein